MTDEEEETEGEISFGGSQTTAFGIELQIGSGDILLHCRESIYGSGPTINLALAGFELIFSAKYLSGIADYLFIACRTLTIRHRPDNSPEYTPWLYPKSAANCFRNYNSPQENFANYIFLIFLNS